MCDGEVGAETSKNQSSLEGSRGLPLKCLSLADDDSDDAAFHFAIVTIAPGDRFRM